MVKSRSFEIPEIICNRFDLRSLMIPPVYGMFEDCRVVFHGLHYQQISTAVVADDNKVRLKVAPISHGSRFTTNAAACPLEPLPARAIEE